MLHHRTAHHQIDARRRQPGVGQIAPVQLDAVERPVEVDQIDADQPRRLAAEAAEDRCRVAAAGVEQRVLGLQPLADDPLEGPLRVLGVGEVALLVALREFGHRAAPPTAIGCGAAGAAAASSAGRASHSSSVISTQTSVP